MEEIKVKYFGEIAEKVGADQELILIERRSVMSLLEFLQIKYGLNPKVIKVAINQELASENSPLTPGDDIAILSPFAGG